MLVALCREQGCEIQGTKDDLIRFLLHVGRTEVRQMLHVVKHLIIILY